MEEDISEEYKSSLTDLNCNSKPLINMLTILADENIKYAAVIVRVIEDHIQKVPPESKLPGLYLIDSIIKNVGKEYLNLFSQSIVSIFCSVFEKVDEKTRMLLYKLRLTWNDIFPNKKLYGIDVRVKQVDPAWPVNAQPPVQSIHVNPRFLGNTANQQPPEVQIIKKEEPKATRSQQEEILKQLLAKQEELRQLQEKKTKLENIKDQSTENSAFSKVQVRPIDPRLAKLDPRITQRDPRLQKTVKTSGAELLSKQESASKLSPLPSVVTVPSINVTTVSHSTFSTTAPVAKDVKSDKDIVSPKAKIKNSQTQEKGEIYLKSKTQLEPTNKIPKISSSPQKAESAVSLKKSPDKKKLDLTCMQKGSKVSDSPDKNKIADDKRKQKCDIDKDALGKSKTAESKKNEAEEKQLEVGKKHTSKLQKGIKDGKNRRSKTFPEGKGSELKSVPRVTRSQSKANVQDQSKIALRNHSRSPLKKGEKDKKYETVKTKRTFSQAHKDKKSKKKVQKEEIEKDKTNAIPSNSKEESQSAQSEFPVEDTDLRILNHPSCTTEQDNRAKAKRELNSFQDTSPSQDEFKENISEPPTKKAKEEIPECEPTDSLFGREDQDYRQMAKNHSTKSNHHKGWAQYKATHPDEFKSPLRPARENMDRDGPDYMDEDFREHTGGKHLIKEQFSGRQDQYHDDSHDVEYDRLGRPRLNRIRHDSRFGRRGDFHRQQVPRFSHHYVESYEEQHMRNRMAYMLSDPDQILRQAEEKLRLGRITEKDFLELRRELQKVWESGERLRMRASNHYSFTKYHDRYRDNTDHLHHVSQTAMGNSVDSKFQETDANHSVTPRDTQKIQGPMMAPPPVRSIKLDSKLRTIHFIGEKAIVLMDNDEPKEITFKGDPTQVFIEGLEPITLSFDGKGTEFDLNGKKYTMRFGAPSRELYINNHPYEGRFGGPPFLAMLENSVYRIKLGGPSPQVQISEESYHELFNEFLASCKEMQKKQCTSNKSQECTEINTDITDKIKESNSAKTSQDTDLRTDPEIDHADIVDTDMRPVESPNSIHQDVDMRQGSSAGDKNKDSNLANSEDCETSNSKQNEYSEEKTEPTLSHMKDVDWRHILPSEGNKTVTDEKLDDKEQDSGCIAKSGPPESSFVESTNTAGQSNSNLPCDSNVNEVTGEFTFDSRLHGSSVKKEVHHDMHDRYLNSPQRNQDNEWNIPPHHNLYEPWKEGDNALDVAKHPYPEWESNQKSMDWEWNYPRYKWHTGQDRVPALHSVSWRDNHMQLPYPDMHHENSPHHTPSSHSPVHQSEWKHVHQARSHEQPVCENRADPESWEWREKEFSENIRRPPLHPHSEVQSPLYRSQRDTGGKPNPQQYEEFPSYYREPPPVHPQPHPMHAPSRHLYNHQRPSVAGRRSLKYRPYGLNFRPWFNRNHQERRPQMGLAPRRAILHPPVPSTTMRMPVNRIANPVIPHQKVTNVAPSDSEEQFITSKLPPTISTALDPSSSVPLSVSAQNEQSNQLLQEQMTTDSSSTDNPALSTELVSENASTVVTADFMPLNTDIDVGALFEKLVAAGIISNPLPEETPADDSEKKNEEEAEMEGEKDKDKASTEEPVPPIEFTLESLKCHYPGVVSAIYRGSQCASCGMRFKEIQGERYSRHLDWHFRVNRREKDGAKKAFSRKWYYDVEDWIQFEEFEDFEERARSFFELQAADEQFQIPGPVEVPSVQASDQEAELCVVCCEAFKVFWVEEKEEWHLKDAVRVEGQAYHPLCYEDFQKASKVPDTPTESPLDDIAPNAEVKDEPNAIAEKEIESGEEKKDKDEKETEVVVKEATEMLSDIVIKEEVMDEVSLQESEEITPLKEDHEEEKLEGKPGEEEIIGVITESEMEIEMNDPPKESKMVVFQSGGIVMKVRAESIQPASPVPTNPSEKDAVPKEESEDDDFRPPTPDPRFQVLPPVQKGTELSGLCSIM